MSSSSNGTSSAATKGNRSSNPREVNAAKNCSVLGWEMFDAHGGWEAALANINRDWRAAMERAGFPPVKVYALVHSFCSQLYSSSGDVQMVQKARGHADIRTTLVYTQLVADPRLAGEMKRAFSADLAKR